MVEKAGKTEPEKDKKEKVEKPGRGLDPLLTPRDFELNSAARAKDVRRARQPEELT